jgi:ketosteroid isomerase-like protein
LIHAIKRAFAEVPMDWHAGLGMVIGQRGDVAWVADRPQVRFDDGSEFLPRVTMVFIDEGGTWKLAHSHYSWSSD